MVVDLKNWLDSKPRNEEKLELFNNMSKTLKYVHQNGYSVSTFNLREIEIMDLEKLAPINYKQLTKISDGAYQQITYHDNYNLAFMQIGIYTDLLDNLRPEFLKSEFESFIPFLPEDEVAYFRAVILNGSNIYYSDYVQQKNERDLRLYGTMDEDSSNSKVSSFQKSKATAAGRAFAERDESAYISLLIFPLIIAIVGIIFSIVLLFTS